MADTPLPLGPSEKSRLDRLLRRVIPSVSRLTYSGLFRRVVNPVSSVATFLFPEFRSLPPAHLRARVGTGNRVLFNHVMFFSSGYWYWMDNFSRQLCSQSSNVVEIGCGCGKIFRPLHDSSEFTGQFVGIDIDREMLAWCRKRFTRPSFRFVESPHANSAYPGQKTGATANGWRVPVEDSSVDFVYSCSLLTHLLEDTVRLYLGESRRMLKRGGFIRMGFFCLDTVEKGFRWSFRHQMGLAFVESPEVPEAAVAYSRDVMQRLVEEAGLEVVEFRLGSSQSEVIARRGV